MVMLSISYQTISNFSEDCYYAFQAQNQKNNIIEN